MSEITSVSSVSSVVKKTPCKVPLNPRSSIGDYCSGNKTGTVAVYGTEEGNMKLMLSGVWQKSKKSVKTVWLIAAGFSALYFGAMKPHLGSRGIAAERVAGVASAEWDPIAMWQAPFYERFFDDERELSWAVHRMER